MESHNRIAKIYSNTIQMIAVLSATEHDYYAFPLPIVVWSWRKIGCRCIVFVPSGNNPKLDLAIEYCGYNTDFYEFHCEEKRIPTFSQVSRLFGAAIPMLDKKETMIVGDSDLCVFGGFFNKLDNDRIHIVGNDLTPKDQYPMCFISMTVGDWVDVMGIDKSYQEHIAELINPIEGINIRGEQWCYDQWYAKKRIDAGGKLNITFHPRARPGTQFAEHRVDRDDVNWRSYVNENLIDAHLWRPGYTDENFANIMELMTPMYPNDDFTWLVDYRNEYLKLL